MDVQQWSITVQGIYTEGLIWTIFGLIFFTVAVLTALMSTKRILRMHDTETKAVVILAVSIFVAIVGTIGIATFMTGLEYVLAPEYYAINFLRG